MKPARDKSYLQCIRMQPCAVCRQMPSETGALVSRAEASVQIERPVSSQNRIRTDPMLITGWPLTIGEGEFDRDVWLPGQFSKFARQVNST
jgi:hypothetical protein